MTVRTLAKPRLKIKIKSRPKPTRPKAMALNIKTRAEGQGNNPPDTPKANKLRQVIRSPSAPGGR